MKMPSKGLMSTLGGMAQNYGSRNAMGLTMFGAGAVGATIAAKNANANGIGVGNSAVGLAGMGLMAAGGRRLGAQRLFNSAGRASVGNRLGGIGDKLADAGHVRTSRGLWRANANMSRGASSNRTWGGKSSGFSRGRRR